jgi:hypothetical protein
VPLFIFQHKIQLQSFPPFHWVRTANDGSA